MSRGLYRFYLYFVAISLTESIAVSLGALLIQVFQYTPLRGGPTGVIPEFPPPSPLPPPDSTALRQAVIQFVVTLVIAGGFGALHYWLIRRDSASDPMGARESGVRAFLLNLYEAGAALTAIIAAVIAMEYIGTGSNYNPDITLPVAISLAALLFALALEFERRRLTPTGGAALDFERLRRHGVPFIVLLAVVLFTVYYAAYNLERLAGHALGMPSCSFPTDTTTYPACVGNALTGELLAALVAVASWAWLLWLGRRDADSLMRQVFLLLGWVIGGMSFLAIALQPAAEFALRRLTPGPDNPRPEYFLQFQFDFGPWAAVAAVALAVYGWALLARAEGAMSGHSVRLALRALAGLVLAGLFWYGVYSILILVASRIGPTYVTPNLALAPPPPFPSLVDWEHAISFLLAGAAYIPLAFWLGAGSRAWETKGPRRGFVLALLAAGALVTASAAVTLLYSLLTGLLNVPQANRLEATRSASAALLTGLALGVLYLVIAIREGQFAGGRHAPEPIPAPTAPPAAAPAPAEPAAPTALGLDEVLAQLEGGAITREVAAARIRDLARAGTL